MYGTTLNEDVNQKIYCLNLPSNLDHIETVKWEDVTSQFRGLIPKDSRFKSVVVNAHIEMGYYRVILISENYLVLDLYLYLNTGGDRAGLFYNVPFAKLLRTTSFWDVELIDEK